VSHFGDYDLVKYVPVPLKNGTTSNYIINGISGPTYVIYNSDGSIGYYRNPFEIRTTNLTESQSKRCDHGVVIYQDNDENLAGYWKLIYPIVSDDNSNFIPSLKETRPNV